MFLMNRVFSEPRNHELGFAQLHLTGNWSGVCSAGPKHIQRHSELPERVLRVPMAFVSMASPPLPSFTLNSFKGKRQKDRSDLRKALHSKPVPARVDSFWVQPISRGP